MGQNGGSTILLLMDINIGDFVDNKKKKKCTWI